VRALSLFWFWIEPCLSNLINGFLTVVAILHSLAFLLGLEVSVTRSFTIPFPNSIFLFYFYSYTISDLYQKPTQIKIKYMHRHVCNIQGYLFCNGEGIIYTFVIFAIIRFFEYVNYLTRFLFVGASCEIIVFYNYCILKINLLTSNHIHLLVVTIIHLLSEILKSSVQNKRTNMIFYKSTHITIISSPCMV
jgi:hypothetical protein